MLCHQRIRNCANTDVNRPYLLLCTAPWLSVSCGGTVFTPYIILLLPVACRTGQYTIFIEFINRAFFLAAAGG